MCVCVYMHIYVKKRKREEKKEKKKTPIDCQILMSLLNVNCITVI